MLQWRKAVLRDQRDWPLLRVILICGFLFPAAGVSVFFLKSVPWWFTALYSFSFAAFFLGPFTLMLHNLSHNLVFRPDWMWIKTVVQVGICPFMGQTPYSYLCHHIGMHHVENNNPNDNSSTASYQRDRIDHFLIYFLQFMTVGIFRVAGYLKRTKRYRLHRLLVWGEGGWYAVFFVLLFWKPMAAMTVFGFPFLIARFGMMAGNWAQHAFIHPELRASPMGYSTTSINTRYNRICFNDGYHIEHHLHPNLHWTEMHRAFERNREMYAQSETIVFDGLDFFQIWGLLMLKRHDILANRLVQWTTKKAQLNEQIALLKSRLKPI